MSINSLHGSINCLPTEMVVGCLSLLPWTDLKSSAQVCNLWRQLILEDVLPKRLDEEFQHFFGKKKTVAFTRAKSIFVDYCKKQSLEQSLSFTNSDRFAFYFPALESKIVGILNRSARLEISSRERKKISFDILKLISRAMLKTSQKSLIITLKNVSIHQLPSEFFSAKIQRLTLAENQIDDEGVRKILEELKNLSRCVFLDLRGNSFNEEGRNALLEAQEATSSMQINY